MASSSPIDDIERYLPLVEQVVVQTATHFPRHVDRSELVRAGVLGLVEAAHRFDEAHGVPFERFAATRIRGAVLDAVRAADWAPRSVRAMSRRVDSTEQSLANRLARTPTTTELADALGSSVEDIKSFRDRVFRSVVLALDQTVVSDNADETTIVDNLHDRTTLEPSEELESRELRAYLRDAVDLLPERHRIVVVGYFLESLSTEYIAAFLGITETRVSQLRSEALVMLKEGIEAQFEVGDEAEVTSLTELMVSRETPYGSGAVRNRKWKNRLGEQSREKDHAPASPDQLVRLKVIYHDSFEATFAKTISDAEDPAEYVRICRSELARTVDLSQIFTWELAELGVPYADIATRMGISKGTVKARVSRMRQRLRNRTLRTEAS